MPLTYLFNRLWYPLLDQAKLRRRGLHQLRHTYVALLIAQGAHPKYIQEQLGHSSIQVTMDIFGHIFEEHRLRHVGTLERVLEATSCNARGTDEAPITPPAIIPTT